MKGLKNDVASISYYSTLTRTISTLYEDLRKMIEAKEYVDYIPDAWAGLIKVMCVCACARMCVHVCACICVCM